MYRKEYNKAWIEKNREHVRAYDRARYAKNPETKLKRASKYYAEHTEKVKARTKYYSKNVASVRDRLKLEQLAGRPRPVTCEVCGAAGKVFFDHDHATGKFRGWLCMQCNLALGHARDNTALLYKLIHYLEVSRASPQLTEPIKSPIQLETKI